MHNRPFRKDEAATKAMHYASRYSYVSHRIHPESDPPHQCEYLAGLADIGKRRLEVFERDGWLCRDCGVKVFDGIAPTHPHKAHLAHGGHTKISRCWCMENILTKCHVCHVKNDHHGRDF